MSADMKPSEALRKARELITPEEAWTQEVFARDAQGGPINFGDPKAVCFCAIGSLLRLRQPEETQSTAEGFLEQAIDGHSISRWNDTRWRTHAEVLDAFDRAAALAEAEGR